MVGTSTTDFTVLPADYFRHILTGAKIQGKWMRAQPEVLQEFMNEITSIYHL